MTRPPSVDKIFIRYAEVWGAHEKQTAKEA